MFYYYCYSIYHYKGELFSEFIYGKIFKQILDYSINFYFYLYNIKFNKIYNIKFIKA